MSQYTIHMDQMEKKPNRVSMYRAAKRVQIQFSFLYFRFLMTVKTMINCQIKCKFICECAVNDCSETPERALHGMRCKRDLISKVTYGGIEDERNVSNRQRKWNSKLKWNQIEMQEANDIRVENMIRNEHFALNKSLCEFDKWWACVCFYVSRGVELNISDCSC